MFKFISPKEQEINIDSIISKVDKSFSPINEIVGKKDFSNYSVLIGEQKISLADCFQLQVNAKSIGTFHFIFSKEGFNKDEIIPQISILKDINVFDEATAKEKVSKLFEITNSYNPLFIIYLETEDSVITSISLKPLFNDSIQTFIIKKEQPAEMFSLEIGQNEEEPEQEPKKKAKKSKSPKQKTSFKKFMKNLGMEIGEKKFHFLLILVSTLLFEVAVPLAILNIYSANALYIFLFICALVGIGMNGYSYYDLFKKTKWNNSISVVSYITNLIGIGIGVGLFILFYNISTIEENTPAIGNLIVIGLLVSFIICIASIVITNFIPKTKKSSKK